MDKLLKQVANDLGNIITSIENDFKIETHEDYENYLNNLKGRYSSVIAEFSVDLYDSYYTLRARSNKAELDIKKIKRDFYNIKGKLEIYVATNGYKYKGLKENADKGGIGNTVIQITNSQSQSQSQNQNLTIKQVTETIINNSALPQEEIDGIILKLNEIEKIVETHDSKPKKWQKIKEIAKFILDKGMDIGIVAIPYIIEHAAKIN